MCFSGASLSSLPNYFRNLLPHLITKLTTLSKCLDTCARKSVKAFVSAAAQGIGATHVRIKEALVFQAHEGLVDRADHHRSSRLFFQFMKYGQSIGIVYEDTDAEQYQFFKLSEIGSFH